MKEDEVMEALTFPDLKEVFKDAVGEIDLLHEKEDLTDGRNSRR